MSSVPCAVAGKTLVNSGAPKAASGPTREVGMDSLNQEQIEAALAELGEWGFTGEALTRTFRFSDFVHAVDFVEALAELAEEQTHHPDIDIRYNKVTLRVSSHDAKGVTARDVRLAQAIDRLI